MKKFALVGACLIPASLLAAPVWDLVVGTSNGISNQSGGFFVDASGNQWSAGYRTGATPNTDAEIARVDSSGSLVFLSQYERVPGSSEYEAFTAVVADSSQNAYVCGRAYNGSNNDTIIAKYTSAGVRSWVTFYNGGGNETPGRRIAFDNSGNIYYVAQKSSPSVTLLKYTTGGSQTFAANVGTGTGDLLAFDPNNSVFYVPLINGATGSLKKLNTSGTVTQTLTLSTNSA